MHPVKISTPITIAAAFFASMSLGQAAFAQAPTIPRAATGETPAPTVAAPLPGILSVPLPPYARLRLDLDARDEDILGVVKSFFIKFDGHSLKELLKSQGVTAANGDKNSATASTPAVDLNKAASLQLLSDADLATILENINHIRVVVFEPRRTNVSAMGTSSAAERQSVVAYYEQKYIEREGGRRIVRADMDSVQMLMVGFPNNGFAAVLQTPYTAVVIRADGYPDFSGIGPIGMAALIQMAPAMPAAMPPMMR